MFGILFFGFSLDVQATSIKELPFGGLHIFALQCTCDAKGSSLHYIFDYRTMKMVSLLYVPQKSILYSNYNPFAKFQMGTYLPGQAACLIVTGPKCTKVMGAGTYGQKPGTGTTISSLYQFFEKLAQALPRFHV